VAGWYFISPLLIDERVDEALVLAPLRMTSEGPNQTRQKAMADLPQKPDTSVHESMTT
jgi:hypothetical protein